MTSGRRCVVIGLSGGIGAGKSEVARALGKRGCVVSDSDALARAALERPEVVAELVSWWGEGIRDASGRASREAVAKIVFTDAAQRKRLEGLVHPLVRSARAEVIERAEREGAPAVVVDAPLLFEAGTDRECEAVIFVDAPREQRAARVGAARGWDEAELSRREASQMGVEEKRRLSRYVVNNTGDLAELDGRVGEVLDEILRRHG